ncbi:hypothetical protein Rmet_6552 [Cupriavidus metallidurans CH34]|uniref:Uncharacterized protein n=1 Tax=Cupriavidus metallidurans (strain ATCC 43123 / DSM 2839 / NBRC 102507 / CH34) TaxID=266264 RepID=D3DXY9_CUPMC|nr:hypothetical protein Rmet_6552 [Cupriavidus metallidurans CH34]
MASTGDGKEFGQSFDNAKDDGFQGECNIHAESGEGGAKSLRKTRRYGRGHEHYC